MRTTFKTSNYWKPTPRRWRQVGDALVVIGGTSAGFSLLMQNQVIAIVITLISLAGKIITNFTAKTYGSD